MACICCEVLCDCRQLENFYGQDINITFGTFSGNGIGFCELSGRTVLLTYCASCGDFGGPGWTGSTGPHHNASGSEPNDQTFNILISALMDAPGGAETPDEYYCLKITTDYFIEEDFDTWDGTIEGTPTIGTLPSGPTGVFLDQCDPTLEADGSVTQSGGSGDPFHDPCKGETATFVIFQ